MVIDVRDEINRLILLYYNAGLNLVDLLKDLEDGIGRRRKEQLLLQVDAILNELTEKASLAYADILALAYKEGVKLAAQSIERFGLKPDVSLKPLIHTQAVQAIMDESFYSILEASDYMSQDIKNRIQDAVRRANQRSLTEGISRKQATRDAIAELSERGITGMITRNGAEIPADKYMAGVVQYHQRKAHVTGAENTITQNDLDLVYVNYVGITCEMCATMQGRVYSISGNDKRFPKLEQRPPYHSHCVHSISAWIEEYQSPQEVERMIAQSNRPFTDNRTAANIRRYNEIQRDKSKKNETRKQWIRYKARMPDLPDLRSFASHKARGTVRYREWQEDYRKIGVKINSEG